MDPYIILYLLGLVGCGAGGICLSEDEYVGGFLFWVTGMILCIACGLHWAS